MGTVKRLNGLVLCGGMSLRMRADKGLLRDGQMGMPWFVTAAQKLAPLCDAVYISIRKEQEESYRSGGLSLITDRDDTGVEGPARGIFSAAMSHPDVDWFVLSTDMIRITPPTLAALRSAWETHQGFDSVCFEVNQCLEPLCAIYSARGLEKLHSEMISRKNYSPTSLLKFMDLYVSALGKISPDEFLSFNSPEDFGL